MKKLALILSILSVLTCGSANQGSYRFNTQEYTLKIPAMYIDNTEGLAPWLEPAKESLDSNDGIVLLTFEHEEISYSVVDFEKSRANDNSLVLLYSEKMNQQALVNVIQQRMPTSLRIEKHSAINSAYSIYLTEDAWDVVEGYFRGNEKDFIVTKMIASCDSGFYGTSCKFFAEMNGAYFTYSVKGKNLNVRNDIEDFYKEKIAGWVHNR